MPTADIPAPSKVVQQARMQRLLTIVRHVLGTADRVDRGLYRIDPADWLALRSAAAQVGRFADGTGGSQWD
jgi:hypothetical protein